ncbi:probable G-protein coupled receptor 141 isoform X2 [Colossoma macropomum]|uniref:probable G-protein coupled receptor 141 isoform X2 n=1 Tax=Colossoma macropomum TaxID=42526 RepID=UPI001863F94E|nr:probable G-protein coupled receptor 141 isoform X2 [Colossoma macropomum]
MNMTTINYSTFTAYTENSSLADSPHRIALISIYTVVLLVGSVGLIVMVNMLKTNLRSWTTIAFLNLLLAHFIFMLTIPFRIHYSVTNKWTLSQPFCKMVSAMIHLHMYLVFVIYTVILTIRFLQYFKKIDRTEFYRRLHALAASVGIWSILIIIGPIILSQYGSNGNKDKCFNFGGAIKGAALALNIVLSVLILLVSCMLSCALGVILYSIIKMHGAACRDQQEFWAQMKSVSLILIIFTCLVPYHLFRLYYLHNPTVMQEDNEVFLAITTLTCFDMLLTFAGKGICYMCKC